MAAVDRAQSSVNQGKQTKEIVYNCLKVAVQTPWIHPPTPYSATGLQCAAVLPGSPEQPPVCSAVSPGRHCSLLQCRTRHQAQGPILSCGNAVLRRLPPVLCWETLAGREGTGSSTDTLCLSTLGNTEGQASSRGEDILHSSQQLVLSHREGPPRWGHPAGGRSLWGPSLGDRKGSSKHCPRHGLSSSWLVS